MKSSRFWSLIGYMMFVYLVMVGLTVLGFGFSDGLGKQLLAYVVPVYDGSLASNLVKMSGTFWGIAIMYILIMTATSKKHTDQL
ncbi:MAG: hypothetical protein KC476_06645 [Cyanobacteria bacterium HKST-UBA06]|nr:hypothetical protein [Cyanobacteria bacterium HKST-UBA05]MCA9798978.1 hypothetical protein [Cyanobacteria bacterium HKST-UBA04]MCA9807617.1 hypothetical protein [Cyanobacteria bacterium HKST-UBA06]MCA9841213.1 hypothetical protein [Cyanobacteria bacterium HKST-UBA03]